MVQICYKVNFITNSFQRFLQHFKNTSYCLLLEHCIFHTKNSCSEYACRTCLKELAIFLKFDKSFETFLQQKMLFFNMCFSNISDNFKNTCFQEHLSMAASENATKHFVLNKYEKSNGMSGEMFFLF